jgi:biopolymer transport protein ExbB
MPFRSSIFSAWFGVLGLTFSTAVWAEVPVLKPPAKPIEANSSPRRGSEHIKSGGLDTMLTSAKADLENSAEQLSKLRTQLDAERLPQVKKLDELEKSLLSARKEYDGVARVLDTRNLDISNLKTEIKLKEDESFYITNLLDEFTRGLETKLHISEIEKFKPSIEKAKAITADANSSTGDKLAAQLTPLKASISRAKELVGGARYSGTALNEQGNVLPGKYALVGPFALFGSDDRSTVGLAVTQTGSSQAIVKPLDKVMNEGIAAIIASGEGLFPLDATNGGAIKQLLNKTSIIDTYIHGGPIMHPLLLTSIVAFSVVIERMIFIFVENRRRRQDLVLEMLDCVEKNDLNRAIKIGRSTKDFVAKTLLYALEHREKSLGSALMLAANKELKRFSRGLPALDTSITIAPLLGLLGTVTGMMYSFSNISGDLSAPGAITGGISEALIATAFGIGIAIVGVIPFNYLNARIDDARHEVEAAATRMELLMKGHGLGSPEGEGEGFKLAAPAASGGGGVH